MGPFVRALGPRSQMGAKSPAKRCQLDRGRIESKGKCVKLAMRTLPFPPAAH
jgi:hypothetical protein